MFRCVLFPETVAALPGGFGTAHAIRLGIEHFAELGGQFGVVSRVPSRFSLFLPSDPQIGPGNAATVSLSNGLFGTRQPAARMPRAHSGRVQHVGSIGGG